MEASATPCFAARPAEIARIIGKRQGGSGWGIIAAQSGYSTSEPLFLHTLNPKRYFRFGV